MPAVADTLPFLRQVPAFGLLDDGDLHYLSEQLQTEHFGIGRVVCRAGDTAEDFYLVLAGRARVVGTVDQGEKTVGTLSRGDHFGEAALLEGGTRGFTVRAAEDLVLLRLSRAAFQRVINRRPELREYFAQYTQDLATRNFLRLCSSLGSLQPREIQALMDHLETREFSAGEQVFRQGDPGDRFYLVRAGRARVEQRGRTLTHVGEGQFFGELALLTHAPRAADIIAETDLSTLTLSAEAFETLLRQYPKLRQSIEAVASSYQSTPWPKAPTPAPTETSEPAPAPETEAAQPVRRSKRWPVVLQIGEMDCGAACLCMVGRYYGRQYRLASIRELAQVSREGASLRGLAETAERLGFRARPVRAELRHLERTTLPAIVHWGGNHWVVVYQFDKRGVTLADPGRGLRRLTREEFQKGWTGVALLLEPSVDLAASEAAPGVARRFFPLVKPHAMVLGEVLLLSLVLEALGLSIPLFTQAILDRVLVHQDLSMLNVMLGGMVLVVVFQLLAGALRQVLLVHTVRRIDLSLGVQLLSHLLRLPARFFENTRTGDLVTRFEEMREVRKLLTGTALTALLSLLTLVVHAIVMVAYSPALTLVLLITAPLFAFLGLVVTPALRGNYRSLFEAHCAVQSHLVETIGGAAVVKAACAERPVRWKWEELLLKQVGLEFRAMNFRLLLDSLSTVVQISVTASLLYFGARLVLAGQLTIGQLMAFFALSGGLLGAVRGLVGAWDEAQNARLSLERLADVLDTRAEEAAETGGQRNTLPAIKGHVRFEGVTFRYAESARRNAVENISLEILPGQTVALVGRSGCGKSTLIKLLLRLYEPTSGRITVDGHDLTKVELASWRRQVGLVAQESYLFSGTIRENIALGHPDATLEEVREAARLAGADEFISDLPLGYNTVVGERGTSLSGGQRQRISIARSLLGDPRILVLDEATSALDTESERAIQRNLDTVLRNRTTLVIAHRLSTVRSADRIVVMDQGVIVEQGTHDELMANRGLYFYLCSQQLQQ